MPTITINGTGNCNIAYISGFGTYKPTVEGMTQALVDFFTNPPDRYNQNQNAAPTLRVLSAGIYYFAQGSEDPVETKPYGPILRRLIAHHKLGSVIATPPVPNILHGNKPGIMYVWILNRENYKKWWERYTKIQAVRSAREQLQKAKEALAKWEKPNA